MTSNAISHEHKWPWSFRPICRDSTAEQGRGRLWLPLILSQPQAGQPQAWGYVVPPKAKYTLGVTVSRQDQAPKCRTTLGTI